MLLKEMIACGNTAEVYATDDEKRIVKLFKSGNSRETAEHEYRNAQLVNEMPFSKPRVYEMLDINGRFGIVYERISAETLLNYALANGRSPEWIGENMAVQHALMLNCACSAELETDKDYYSRFISYSKQLTENEKSQLYAKLEAMPCGSSLCHGDYHPQNITTDGESFAVIDFMNVYKGNPLSDIARAYYLVALNPIPAEIIGEERSRFVKLKLAVGDSYTEKMEQAGFTGWREWLPIIIAARSGDGIAEEEQRFAGELFRRF